MAGIYEAHKQDFTYHSEVARILQEVFDRPFREGTTVEDRYDADDFVADETWDDPRIEVCARMRNHDYRHTYAASMLIRTSRPRSGNETELDKLQAGKGNYYLYGFRKKSRQIAAWFLFNLDKARAYPHLGYILSAQPTMSPYPDSTCKDLPLFNADGLELFPGAIECSIGMFWSDRNRQGRPLPPDELLRVKPPETRWNLAPLN